MKTSSLVNREIHFYWIDNCRLSTGHHQDASDVTLHRLLDFLEPQHGAAVGSSTLWREGHPQVAFALPLADEDVANTQAIQKIIQT